MKYHVKKDKYAIPAVYSVVDSQGHIHSSWAPGAWARKKAKQIARELNEREAARGNPRSKRFSASPRGIVKAVRAALRLNRAGKRVKISVRTKR